MKKSCRAPGASEYPPSARLRNAKSSSAALPGKTSGIGSVAATDARTDSCGMPIPCAPRSSRDQAPAATTAWSQEIRPASVTTPAVETPPATTTWTAGADAYVGAASPTSSYGSATSLRVDMSPDVRSYLRFEVGALASVLRLLKLPDGTGKGRGGGAGRARGLR